MPLAQVENCREGGFHQWPWNTSNAKNFDVSWPHHHTILFVQMCRPALSRAMITDIGLIFFSITAYGKPEVRLLPGSSKRCRAGGATRSCGTGSAPQEHHTCMMASRRWVDLWLSFGSHNWLLITQIKCNIKAKPGPWWEQKSLDLRSRDFCPHREPRGELTHRGPVTQYCGGSILCRNPIFFTMVNENKELSYCEALRCETKKMLLNLMSNFQIHFL